MEKTEEKRAEGAKEETLEEAFARLDGLIRKLEDAETPLEESFSLYREGMEILRGCEEKISLVEKKVLMLEDNGEWTQF